MWKTTHKSIKYSFFTFGILFVVLFSSQFSSGFRIPPGDDDGGGGFKPPIIQKLSNPSSVSINTIRNPPGTMDVYLSWSIISNYGDYQRSQICEYSSSGSLLNTYDVGTALSFTISKSDGGQFKYSIKVRNEANSALYRPSNWIESSIQSITVEDHVVTISGNIKDTFGDADVSGAKVTFCHINNVSTTTNANGYFSLRVQKNYYEGVLQVSKEKYELKELAIIPSSDLNIRVDINRYQKDVLVLVHGFYGSPIQMENIESAIKDYGGEYDKIINFDLYTDEADNGDRRLSGTYDMITTKIGPNGYDDINSPSSELSFAKRLYDNLTIELDKEKGFYNCIDFIGHSMGGLVIRSMLKYYSDNNVIEDHKVRTVATLSTPNHGTIPAGKLTHALKSMTTSSEFTAITYMAQNLFLFEKSILEIVCDNIRQEFPAFIEVVESASFCLDNLDDIQFCQMAPDSLFLKYLNADDETPDDINWVTICGKKNNDLIDIVVDSMSSAQNIQFDVILNAGFEIITDIGFRTLEWESRIYDNPHGPDIPYMHPIINEIPNDGVVNTNSTALDGSTNIVLDYWDHNDTFKWNETGSKYEVIRQQVLQKYFLPIYTPANHLNFYYGNIQVQDGSDNSNINVIIQTLDGISLGSTVTDSQGNFEILNLNAEGYWQLELFAWRDNLVGDTMEISANPGIHNLRSFTLNKGWVSYNGIVKNSLMAIICNAEIEILRGTTILAICQTDENGEFTTPTIASSFNNNYILRVRCNGYTTMEIVADADDGDWHYFCKLLKPNRITISGVVSAKYGSTLSGALVQIRVGSVVIASMITGSNGCYSLTVDAGYASSYSVYCFRDEFITKGYTTSGTVSSTINFSLLADETVLPPVII
ncbi:alpha/beta hydrolase [Candidatus Lokiarchaeum ossiferum]|uniref:alpha/beta hydrolase n=1 Tax=Candidatus Lokiarchaeum ossiferum TaxID=2951803 RepID=UPI00352E6512